MVSKSDDNFSGSDGLLTRRERRELAREDKKKLVEKSNSVSKFKKYLAWILVLGIVAWLGNKVFKFFATPVPDVVRIPVEVYDNDWVKGDPDSKVTLIEYGDFQCPSCALYEPMLKKLLEDTTEGFRIVYRHFPLTNIHKNALSASKAAEAAGIQGKFWEMHDILFEKQDDWVSLADPKNKFIEYAVSLSLDENMFSEDYDSGDITSKIDNDIASGNSLKVNATPTFYLNGKFIQPRSYEQFKKLVYDEIGKVYKK